MNTTQNAKGFTIVELLVVIVVIGVLSSFVVLAYSGIRARGIQASQETALSQLKRAIMTARINTDKRLLDITGSSWTGYSCTYIWSGGNTTNTLPSQLPKTNICWTSYYAALDAIQIASGTNLQTLRKGDANGNPYYIDENEGDPVKATPCSELDVVSVYKNKNADLDFDMNVDIPFYTIGCT